MGKSLLIGSRLSRTQWCVDRSSQGPGTFVIPPTHSSSMTHGSTLSRTCACVDPNAFPLPPIHMGPSTGNFLQFPFFTIVSRPRSRSAHGIFSLCVVFASLLLSAHASWYSLANLPHLCPPRHSSAAVGRKGVGCSVPEYGWGPPTQWASPGLFGRAAWQRESGGVRLLRPETLSRLPHSYGSGIEGA